MDTLTQLHGRALEAVQQAANPQELDELRVPLSGQEG